MAPDSLQFRNAPLWMDDVRKWGNHVRFPLPNRAFASNRQLHDEAWTSLDQCRGLSS